MWVLKDNKTLFVDVDDTLVIWEGEKYRAHKKHVELIKRFAKRGQSVVVWSAGGYKWAHRIVRELGLRRYVKLVMAKPQWYVDDLRADEILPEVNRIYLYE